MDALSVMCECALSVGRLQGEGIQAAGADALCIMCNWQGLCLLLFPLYRRPTFQTCEATLSRSVTHLTPTKTFTCFVITAIAAFRCYTLAAFTAVMSLTCRRTLQTHRLPQVAICIYMLLVPQKNHVICQKAKR